MKKVLFATTALIATAGMAAADVTLSGSGRFGIVYNSSLKAAGQSKTRVERRTTINIDGSGSTDGGLEFGGRIRLRSDEGDGTGSVASSNVWMGNDMFRITVGNTDGAMLNRLNYFAGSVGLTGINYNNLSFNMGNGVGGTRWAVNSYSSRGNAGDVVRLDFNVGGFGVSLSTDSTGDNLSNNSEDAIALSYNFGDWTVAAGHANDFFGTKSLTSVSINGSIGDFGVGLNYSDMEDTASKAVLSGSYNFGETAVTAFVSSTSWDTAAIQAGAGSTEKTEYGIGFTHSLGGATLAGGISKDYADTTHADLGVRFNF